MKKQHHMDVPGAGGHGSRQGDNTLNAGLMKPQPNVEQTSFIRDKMYAWPSMYDMSRTITFGKWGESGKDKKVGN